MTTRLARFIRDRRGATAIEYGLIAALISVGLLVGLQNYYEALQALFAGVATTLATVWG